MSSDFGPDFAPDPTGRNDLWCTDENMDHIPLEAALIQWREASGMLDGLVDMAQHQSNVALYVALNDARARAYEATHRHENEVKMRRMWAEAVEAGRAG